MYLTPDDIEIALRNGISEERVKARFYRSGWSVKRATTEPVRVSKNGWAKYKDVSVVSVNTFYQRIQRGMSPEDAALIPTTPRGGRVGNKFKVTQEDVAEAAKNGISENTLRYRVSKYKWSVERARTEPV
jgi:hypothetical protein